MAAVEFARTARLPSGLLRILVRILPPSLSPSLAPARRPLWRRRHKTLRSTTIARLLQQARLATRRAVRTDADGVCLALSFCAPPGRVPTSLPPSSFYLLILLLSSSHPPPPPPPPPLPPLLRLRPSCKSNPGPATISSRELAAENCSLLQLDAPARALSRNHFSRVTRKISAAALDYVIHSFIHSCIRVRL